MGMFGTSAGVAADNEFVDNENACPKGFALREILSVAFLIEVDVSLSFKEIMSYLH